MSNVIFGQEVTEIHKQVTYVNGSGATKTIYEGEPFCYIFDTTNNYLGYDKGNAVEGTTTAEGYNNEGKYLFVENPATDNLQWFAGVTARGSWCGKQVANGASLDIEIIVPNGAIVPVRAGIECTVGRTVLAVLSGTQYLGHPLVTTGRPVAIAEETNAGLDTTPGLILAKLDPNLFLYQSNTSTALLCGTGGTAASATQILNIINLSSGHTGGYVAPLQVLVDCTGAQASAGGSYAISCQTTVSGSITGNGYTRVINATLNLTGTINAGQHMAAVMAQLGGSPTFTKCEHVQCLWADASLGANPTSGTYNIIKMTNNGANQTAVDNAFYVYGGYGINKLFYFDTCDGITANFISNGGTGGATKVITSGGDWKKVKCSIEGTDYFLILMVNPSEIDRDA